MMNYLDTKKFQSYIMQECDNILSIVSKILIDNLKDVHDILSTDVEFRAFCNKIIPNKISNIGINSFDIKMSKGITLSDTLDNSIIKSMNLTMYFNGNKFGIDIKVYKSLIDNNSYRYDAKYSILGSIRYHEYVDCHYDSRYFPITISRNPYNIFFLNDDLGVISTIEYIGYYDFKEFSSNYNDWNEDNFLIQKFTI